MVTNNVCAGRVTSDVTIAVNDETSVSVEKKLWVMVGGVIVTKETSVSVEKMFCVMVGGLMVVVKYWF